MLTFQSVISSEICEIAPTTPQSPGFGWYVEVATPSKNPMRRLPSTSDSWMGLMKTGLQSLPVEYVVQTGEKVSVTRRGWLNYFAEARDVVLKTLYPDTGGKNGEQDDKMWELWELVRMI